MMSSLAFAIAALLLMLGCATVNDQKEAPISSATPTISRAYADQIRACIRPHVVFAVPQGTSDQVHAVFKVELLPTGEQAAPPRLAKSSGLPGYDDAAYQAIVTCNPFPRDRDGTVPRSFTLKMYPTDLPAGTGSGGAR
jgi:TonB C terminal